MTQSQVLASTFGRPDKKYKKNGYVVWRYYDLNGTDYRIYFKYGIVEFIDY